MAFHLRANAISIVVTFAIILVGHPTRGTAVSPQEPGTAIADFPGQFIADMGRLPSRESGLWLLTGATLAVVVHQFEDPAGVEKTLDQPGLDAVSDFGNIWGDILVQAPLALGTWAIGSLVEKDGMTGLGFDLSRGLLESYLTVGITKRIFPRTRPNGEKYSFPSGHTAAAFTTAGVVSRRYGGWASGVAIGLGVFTAMGRMEDMKHYGSDVVAGATIGWIYGRNAGGREEQTDGVAWQLVPMARGIAVAGRF